MFFFVPGYLCVCVCVYISVLLSVLKIVLLNIFLFCFFAAGFLMNRKINIDLKNIYFSNNVKVLTVTFNQLNASFLSVNFLLKNNNNKQIINTLIH